MKRYIIFALVAALLSVGLFMPDMALGIYEGRLEAGAVSFQNNDISLSIGENYNYFDALFLFTECSAQLELAEGNRLTGDQAAEICKELRKRFFPDNNGENMSVKPYLLAKGEDMASSGIYWMACWFDQNGDFDGTIWIDDERGLLISCGGRLLHEVDAGKDIVVYASSLKDVAVLLSTYFLEVKGVENAVIEGNEDQYIISLLSDNGMEGYFKVFRQSDNMFYVVPHRDYFDKDMPF